MTFLRHDYFVKKRSHEILKSTSFDEQVVHQSAEVLKTENPPLLPNFSM